jgi:hypothetical protein
LSSAGRGTARPLDGRGVRIEGEHVRRVAGDAERKASFAAAELEQAAPTEVAQPPQRGEMGAFRVEHRCHREHLMRSAYTP